MALQKTPPLGWPHTEADKYQQGVPVVPKVTGADITISSTTDRKSRSCCSGIFLLMLLAVVGIAVAIVLGVEGLSDVVPTDDFEAAESAFLQKHPNWEVEVADYPDSGLPTVRLVAWDGARDIGRLVFLDPDMSIPDIWYERPIAPGESDQSQEALLDAFAETFSGVSWSYLRDAEQLDPDADPGAWLVWYREWEEDTGEWSGLLQTVAEKDAATGTWVVYGPDESSSETTATTP